jgi:4-amino-4-deoxy-L-arabinose transferase-like glycosyltransferase
MIHALLARETNGYMADVSETKDGKGGAGWRAWAVDLAGGRGRLLLILGMLVTAFAVRVYRLWEPPMDFHPTRQYIGAIVARSYYYNLNGDVPREQRHRAQTAKDHITLLEPQILPALAAGSYVLAGGEHLWIPRFYSVCAWLAGGLFILLAARELGGSPKIRLIALAFYWLAPFSVLNSRTFQPDPLMLLFMLAAYWLILRYDQRQDKASMLCAALVASASVFLKPVGEFPLFATFYFLLLRRHGFVRAAVHPHLIIYTSIMMAPAVIYYGAQLASGGYVGEQADKTFVAALPFRSDFWLAWLEMIARNIGILGLAAAVFGLWRTEDPRIRSALGGAWFGYFCYGMIFNYHIHTHDYYSMMVIPFAALSAAPLAAQALDRAAGLWRKRRSLVVGIVLAACVLGLSLLGILTRQVQAGGLPPLVKSRIKQAGLVFGIDKKLAAYLGRGLNEREEVRRLETIGELVNHSDKTLFLTHDFGMSLCYHGEISGEWWPGQAVFKRLRVENKEAIDAVALLRERVDSLVMKYFVATDLDEFSKQPELGAELAQHYTQMESNAFFIVYALKPAETSAPPRSREDH